jgi:predicted dehydrogenase
MKKIVRSYILIVAMVVAARAQQGAAPIRIAIVGLVHDHVRQFIPEVLERPDYKLVGIVEPNQALVSEIASRFHLDPGIFFPTFDALRSKVKVQAVAIFTSTLDHRAVVEECAPLGIHAMMEKPMAVSLADARAIADAAKKGNIQIVVNYETTWYPSTQTAYEIAHERHGIGDLRKIVVRDGHPGPAPWCSPYFMAWLTDPVMNGGGVLMDFGCYGADLATWFMDGKRPSSVLAVTQHFQPEVYTKVEDEATIVLTYPRAQAIIQASWNWPFNRKDMDIYGKTGALRLPDRKSLFIRIGDSPEVPAPVGAPVSQSSDSLSYYAAVVRGQVRPSGLSSLATNLIVCEILDAAKESARTGKVVTLDRN